MHVFAMFGCRFRPTIRIYFYFLFEQLSIHRTNVNDNNFRTVSVSILLRTLLS